MHHLVGNAEEAEDLAQEVFLRSLSGAEEVSGSVQILHLAFYHRQQSRRQRLAFASPQTSFSAAGK